MSNIDIRVAIADAVNAFKTETGQLPIRVQVSRVHLKELEDSPYEFPDGSTIAIDFVEGMAAGVVRCIGAEVIRDELE